MDLPPQHRPPPGFPAFALATTAKRLRHDLDVVHCLAAARPPFTLPPAVAARMDTLDERKSLPCHA